MLVWIVVARVASDNLSRLTKPLTSLPGTSRISSTSTAGGNRGSAKNLNEKGLPERPWPAQNEKASIEVDSANVSGS